MELKKLFNHALIVQLRQIRGGNFLTDSIRKLLLCVITLFTVNSGWAQAELTWETTDDWNNQNECVSHAGEISNVTFQNRIFNANEWNGICMPFDADKIILDNTFGEGKYEIQLYSETEETTLIFKKITDTTTIPAGTPCLLKTTETIENPRFCNVKLTNPIQKDFIKKETGNDAIEFRGFYFYHFLYTLNDMEQNNSYYIVNPDGTLDKNPGNVSGLNGIFAYIFVNNNTTTPRIRFEGATTGGEGEGDGNDTPSTSYIPLTNLPAVYIDNVTTTNADGITTFVDLNHIDNYPYNQKTEEYFDAKITIVNPSGIGSVMEMQQEAVTIRGRGNSTWYSHKKPYRLKFPKKKELLGENFSKAKSWTLIANAFDKSMIRNALTYDVGKFMNMPFCPAAQFVDLYLCGEYRGTYQISDHVQVADKRVPVNEDTGWFFEAVTKNNAYEEPYYQPQDGPYINIKNPEDNFLSEELSDIKTYCDKAYATVTKDYDYIETEVPATGYRAYWEENDLIDYYVASELIGNDDAFISMYSYKENINDKLHMGPLWDQDIAYGNSSDFISADNINVFVKDWGQNKTSMFQTFMKDPRFAEQANLRWKEIYNKDIVNILLNRIDELAEIINESQQKNYELGTKNGISSWMINSPDVACMFGGHIHDTYKEYITELKDYIQKRATALNTLFEDNYQKVWENQGDMTYDVTAYKNLYEYRKKAYTTTISGRTFKANEWTTICLPFDMTESRLKNVFGDDYVLREFSGVENNIIKFTEPKNNEIIGGVPYLVRISTEKSGKIDFGIESVNTYQNAAVATVEHDGYTLKGLITPETVTGYTITATGKELEAINTSILNGSFAYITLPENTDASNITVYIEGYDNEPQPETRKQISSNVPTIYIDTQDKAEIQPSTGSYVNATIEVIDEKKSIEVFSTTDPALLEIRGRGTDSWNNTDKKSYRLKFAKKNKHYMLGEDKYDKRNWTLLANAGDKSLLRNALTKELGDAIGMPFTPGYKFADLVINGTYVGTYQISDHIETDGDRVYRTNEDTDWLIEMTNKKDAEAPYVEGEDYTYPYITVKNPEPAENLDGTTSDVVTPIKNFFDSLWNGIDNYTADGYRKYIDKETFIKWYIASEILGGYNNLTDIYAYKGEEDNTLFFGPLWNNEASFDNHANQDMTSLMKDLDTEDSYNGMLFNTSDESAWKTKIAKLWKDPWFAQAVKACWTEIYNKDIKSVLLDKATETAEYLKESQAHNFSANSDGNTGAGWKLSGAGITGVTKDDSFNDYEAAVEQVKTYIDTRFDYLNNKINELAEKAGTVTLIFDAAASEEETMAQLNDYIGSNVNIQIKNRTFSKDYWNTLTLPFDVSEEQMNEVFGAGYDLEVFSDIDENSYIWKFKTAVPGEIKAGYPYLFKPGEPIVDEPIFNNVTLKPNNYIYTDEQSYIFKPALFPVVLKTDKTERFFGDGDKLYYPTSQETAKMNGIRAYFSLPSNVSNAKVVFMDNEITDITTIDYGITDKSVEIYNLNGQRLTNRNHLPKGVYIISNRKVIIK